jgi:hypothetical protein
MQKCRKPAAAEPSRAGTSQDSGKSEPAVGASRLRSETGSPSALVEPQARSCPPGRSKYKRVNLRSRRIRDWGSLFGSKTYPRRACRQPELERSGNSRSSAQGVRAPFQNRRAPVAHPHTNTWRPAKPGAATVWPPAKPTSSTEIASDHTWVKLCLLLAVTTAKTAHPPLATTSPQSTNPDIIH